MKNCKNVISLGIYQNKAFIKIVLIIVMFMGGTCLDTIIVFANDNHGGYEIGYEGIIRENGLVYKLNDDASCSVCDYEDFAYLDYIVLSGEVTISSTIVSNGITYTVTDICEGCFSGNDKITKINLPSSITRIGSDAFANMPNLTSLTIPGNVCEITGSPCVNSNKLVNLVVSSNNKYFSSDDYGNIYNKEKTKLLYVSPSVTKIVVPEGMELGEDAFIGNNYIQEVTLPSTITTIPTKMFLYCEGLEKVNLSEGILEIGDRAFLGCKNLCSINFPDTLENIDEYAFSFCESLSQITFPKGMKKISVASFEGCSKLTIVSFPTALDEIGMYAFEECVSLKSVILPSGIKRIGASAFNDCTSLESIYLPEGIEVIEDGFATSVFNGAFSGCVSLTSITLPSTLKKLGFGAFARCSNLNKVTILSKDVEIGSLVFYGCSYPIVFYGYSNSTVQQYVKEISPEYDYQFYFSPLDGSGMYNYNNVKDTLPTVGTQKTISSVIYKVTKSTSSQKEVTFVKSTNSKKTSVTIPSTVTIDGYTYKVTEIAPKAFKSNKKLKSVTIGKNVKKIGKETFYNCTKLKKITIKSSVLKSVGKNAIKNINKKATIKVPKKKLKSYKKLFKSKTGYKKTMKIKK